jgi:Ca2+-binding EF-hand superfamily protein
MSRIVDVLTRIKKACQVCGLPISDLLSEYDRGRTGQISLSQLQRAFSTLGLRLRPQDFQDLTIEYKSGDGLSISSLVSAVDQSETSRPPNPHPELAADLLAISHELSLHHHTLADRMPRRNLGSVSSDDFVRGLGATPGVHRVAAAFSTGGNISLGEVEFAVKSAQKSAKPPPAKPKPEQVLRAIDHIVRFNVDARAGFEASDRHRRGKLAPHVFTMILSTFSGIQMSPGDIQVVTQHYSEGGEADYAAMLRDIEAVQGEVRAAATSEPAAFDVAKLLETLRRVFVERRLTPRDVFHGRMTKYAFEKLLRLTVPLLTAAEVSAVAANFATGSEVDCDAFAATFDVLQKSESQLPTIIETIKATLAQKKLRVRPRLIRFDRMGTGEVFLTQFAVALQNSGVALGGPQLEELLRAFPGSARNTLNIAAFCDATEPESAANEPPQAQPEPSSPRQIASPSGNAWAVVSRVVKCARNRRVDLASEFRRADRLRHGRVNDTHFRAVMAGSGITSGGVTEAELRTLFSEYLTDGEFDYVSFCRDSDQPEFATTPPSDDLDVALRKCKAMMGSKMVTADSLFQRYDRSGNGEVPIATLRKAFVDLGLLLAPSEIDALTAAFASGDRFRYRDFDRHLSVVVVPREQYEPTLFREYTQEEAARILSGARTELREKLRVRPRSWRRLLEKLRQGKVSENDFLAVLDESGVVLLKEQIEALLNYYRVPGTRDIDILRFSQEIENSHLIGRS